MKLSILLILIISAFNPIDAQLLELGKKWIFDYRYDHIFDSYTEEIHEIVVEYDTIINGKNYFALISSDVPPCGYFRLTEYLREEDDKVYRLNESGDAEHLIMDFNVQNSYDVFYETDPYPGGVNFEAINDEERLEVLPSGESVVLTHQRLINNQSYEDNTLYKLSRELGYVQYGMLFPNIGTGLCDVFEENNLRCVISRADTTQLSELGCYESSLISSSSELHTRAIPVVYPNPTDGIVFLDRSYDYVSLYSSLGRLIVENVDVERLDISMYPVGVYSLVLRNKTGAVYSLAVFKR